MTEGFLSSLRAGGAKRARETKEGPRTWPRSGWRAWEDACEPALRQMFPRLEVTRDTPHAGDFLLTIPFWPDQPV